MRTNDLLAHFTDALSLFLKVVSHQLFADADATVLAVLRFKATVQIFVEMFEERGKPFRFWSVGCQTRIADQEPWRNLH